MIPAIDWLNSIITEELLFVGWLIVIVATLYVVKKAGIWGLVVLIGIAIPWTSFYAMRAAHLFGSTETAVSYSRIAHTITIIGLLLALIMMCRVSCLKRQE